MNLDVGGAYEGLLAAAQGVCNVPTSSEVRSFNAEQTCKDARLDQSAFGTFWVELLRDRRPAKLMAMDSRCIETASASAMTVGEPAIAA